MLRTVSFLVVALHIPTKNYVHMCVVVDFLSVCSRLTCLTNAQLKK